MPEPLSTDAIQIAQVEFVGTNVQMSYLVGSSRAAETVGRQLDALLKEKLGLYALTYQGSDEGIHRFAVMASPLDRLFHKIGPPTALTLIKHYSQGSQMSEAQLTRAFTALVDEGKLTPESHLKPWDAGRALAYLERHVARIGDYLREVRIMDGYLLDPGGGFPIPDLRDFPAEVAAAGGIVKLELPQEVIDTLTSI